MTYADILILLKAGYTKTEIEAMDQPEQAAPAAEPETQPAAPAPEAPAEEQTPAAQPDAPQDPTQQILMQLTELVKSVQANNRSMAEMGAEIIEPRQQAINTLKSLGGIPDNN